MEILTITRDREMCIIELPPVINIRKFCRAHFILLIYPRAMRHATRRGATRRDATRRRASLRSARTARHALPRCVLPFHGGFLSPATLSLTGRAGVARGIDTRHQMSPVGENVLLPPLPGPSSSSLPQDEYLRVRRTFPVIGSHRLARFFFSPRGPLSPVRF